MHISAPVLLTFFAIRLRLKVVDLLIWLVYLMKDTVAIVYTPLEVLQKCVTWHQNNKSAVIIDCSTAKSSSHP